MRKIFFVLAALWIAAAGTVKAADKEIYAVFDSDSKTLTILYDDQREAKSGVLEWWKNATMQTATKAVFDESVKDARPEDTNDWFYRFSSLEQIEHIDYLNTSEVTGMTGMFEDCSSLTKLDLRSFNIEKVEFFNRTFSGCTYLQELNIRHWILNPYAETALGMFAGCSHLKTIYCDHKWESKWKFFVADAMFSGCNKLVGGNGTTYNSSYIQLEYARPDEPGKPGYFTKTKEIYAILESDGTTMTLYYDAEREAKEGVMDWTYSNSEFYKDVTKVVFDKSFKNCNPTSTANWFSHFEKLTDFEHLDYLNTKEVKNMRSMFENCSALDSMDVGSFNTKNVTDMHAMFAGCAVLRKIVCDDDWSESGNVTDSEDMFKGCTKLVGGQGTAYDENHLDVKYAKADGLYDKPGYFTNPRSIAGGGALKGKFSTNAAGTTAIQFSQGNLQYQASTDKWRFAENQYDIIGKDNENISATYDGWIDLFGWGTSGYENKYPYMTSEVPEAYGAGAKKSITGTEYDWGVHNAISNGGNVKGAWRTLDTELTNIIKRRPNADKLFGFGSINGINGMILLPDDWTDPDGLPAFKPALENGLVWDSEDYVYENANENNFSQNTYTKSEWNVMEANGAVFLPVTGYRLGTTFKGITEEEGIEVGWYWMSTYPGWLLEHNYHTAFHVFADNILALGSVFSDGQYADNAHFGYAVRLIKDYEAPAAYYAVTINQPEHGTISFQGTEIDLSAVAEGTKLHFVATPEDGYELDAWSGCEADGSLTVNADATVTCTFKKQTFQVTFVDWDDAILKAAQTVVWGEAAVPPADPTREGFKFTGWDTDFSSVKSDLTVKAKYEERVFYTVTFLDWDATELLKETVEKGHDAKGPATNPYREGYKFTGWTKPITNITADLTVIALYEKIPEGIEEISQELKANSQKLIINGQLFILRDGKMYNVLGVEVK